MIKKIGLMVSLVGFCFSIGGCASNEEKSGKAGSIEKTEAYGALFVPRCVQREAKKGTLNAVSWCECYLEELRKPNRTLDDMHYACNHLKLGPEDQLEPAESNCKEYDYSNEPKIGDVVERYRTYRGGEWRDGIPKKYNGIVWKINRFENGLMYLELLEGEYWGKPVGHIAYLGDPEYRYYNPGSKIYSGVLKSFRVCTKYN